MYDRFNDSPLWYAVCMSLYTRLNYHVIFLISFHRFYTQSFLSLLECHIVFCFFYKMFQIYQICLGCVFGFHILFAGQWKTLNWFNWDRKASWVYFWSLLLECFFCSFQALLLLCVVLLSALFTIIPSCQLLPSSTLKSTRSLTRQRLSGHWLDLFMLCWPACLLMYVITILDK